MPNHWHLVVWPRKDGQLSTFMRLLTVTHVRRCHAHRDTAGTGPIYQGRFKSFPVQEDRHFLIVCRYVERNPVRANLVRQIARWRWSSLWARAQSTDAFPWLIPQEEWPVQVPAGLRPWERFVEQPETAGELEALQRSLRRGAPFGSQPWTVRIAKRLDLQSSLRPPHRPKKQKTDVRTKKDS
jgi:putative transposase